MGTSNRLCLHPDETVAKARALRAEGASYKQIANSVGVPISTAWRWCNTTRKPPVAVRVAKARSPESLHFNRQRQGVKGAHCAPFTVTDTDGTPTPDIEDLL